MDDKQLVQNQFCVNVVVEDFLTTELILSVEEWIDFR
jgi:hypothetical protein